MAMYRCKSPASQCAEVPISRPHASGDQTVSDWRHATDATVPRIAAGITADMVRLVIGRVDALSTASRHAVLLAAFPLTHAAPWRRADYL